MPYHVLEILGSTDGYSMRRLFTFDEVPVEFSRHGADETIFCATWVDTDLPLRAIQERVEPFAESIHTQIKLVTGVIEPPYRMKPHPLDHGTLVRIWNEGVGSRLDDWPDLTLLPEATRRVLTALTVKRSVGDPQIQISDEDGRRVTRISLTMNQYMFQSPSFRDRVYEALEATGTEEAPIFVEITPVDPLDRWRTIEGEAE